MLLNPLQNVPRPPSFLIKGIRGCCCRWPFYFTFILSWTLKLLLLLVGKTSFRQDNEPVLRVCRPPCFGDRNINDQKLFHRIDPVFVVSGIQNNNPLKIRLSLSIRRMVCKSSRFSWFWHRWLLFLKSHVLCNRTFKSRR